MVPIKPEAVVEQNLSDSPSTNVCLRANVAGDARSMVALTTSDASVIEYMLVRPCPARASQLPFAFVWVWQ